MAERRSLKPNAAGSRPVGDAIRNDMEYKPISPFDHSLFISRVFASCDNEEQSKIWEDFVRELHHKYIVSLDNTLLLMPPKRIEERNIKLWKKEGKQIRERYNDSDRGHTW